LIVEVVRRCVWCILIHDSLLPATSATIASAAAAAAAAAVAAAVLNYNDSQSSAQLIRPPLDILTTDPLCRLILYAL